MMIFVAAAFAGSPHLPGDALAATSLGLTLAGGGLAGGGVAAGDETMFSAGVVTLLAAPPALAVSFFVEQGALKAEGRAGPSGAGVISAIAWGGSVACFALGSLDPYDDETTSTLAVVGLWGTSMAAGVVGKVQQWERRPPPTSVSLGVMPLRGGGGLLLSGQF